MLVSCPPPEPLPAPEDAEEQGFPGTEPSGSRRFASKAMQTSYPPPPPVSGRAVRDASCPSL